MPVPGCRTGRAPTGRGLRCTTCTGRPYPGQGLPTPCGVGLTTTVGKALRTCACGILSVLSRARRAIVDAISKTLVKSRFETRIESNVSIGISNSAATAFELETNVSVGNEIQEASDRASTGSGNSGALGLTALLMAADSEVVDGANCAPLEASAGSWNPGAAIFEDPVRSDRTILTEGHRAGVPQCFA